MRRRQSPRSPPVKSPASSRIRPARPCPARPSPSPTSPRTGSASSSSSGEGVYTAAEPGARRVPHRRRAGRIQAGAPRRHPSVDRRKGADRLRARRRRRARAGHGHGGRADPARRDGQPRDRRRARAGRAAAAERPHVHHAGGARARRRAAAELAASAHQRRPAAHQRVSVRRHLGAAAGAGPGGVLPGHRRDSGVQDREQQPAGRVRPLQRRRHQPDDQGGHERVSRHRLRVLPQRGAERAELLSVDEPGEAGLPAQPVRRHARRTAGARTARSSSSTTRGSGSRSAARSPPPCRRCCSGRASSPRRSAAACRSSTIRRRPSDRRARRLPGNTIPPARMDPVALALLQRYPLPTSAGHGQQLPPDRRTRSTTRISGTRASITSSRRTAIRCSAACRISATASCR